MKPKLLQRRRRQNQRKKRPW